ncbi:MAG: DUF4445 domain-containing protein [Phycisphaerales bacterium]|nr:DUF4445 domain-containing protein [Phycisphaerales bacterium]
MVLCDGRRLTVCAKAAGPAFEGVGQSCGVRTSRRAIRGGAWPVSHRSSLERRCAMGKPSPWACAGRHTSICWRAAGRAGCLTLWLRDL